MGSETGMVLVYIINSMSLFEMPSFTDVSNCTLSQ